LTGLLEYQPDGFGVFDRYDLSLYGVVTLAKFDKFKLSGVGGFEWYTSSFGDLELADPYFGFGAMGQYSLYKGLGGWMSVTNTLADGTKLFDILKGRVGLSYTF